MLVRSGDPPSVITVPMLLDISSSTVRELLGNQTFCGSYSCADKQVTFGHVCSSFSVEVLVGTPSIGHLEDNKIIKSWSSVATKIGASSKGLYLTVIPYARSWLGFTRLWSVVSHIQISLLRISIVLSPVSWFPYAVAAWTIGTAFMVFYASVYGVTSHSLPVKCTTMQLELQKLCPRVNPDPSWCRPLILVLGPIPSSSQLEIQVYCASPLNESSQCSAIHYCFLLCVLMWWIGSLLIN